MLFWVDNSSCDCNQLSITYQQFAKVQTTYDDYDDVVSLKKENAKCNISISRHLQVTLVGN